MRSECTYETDDIEQEIIRALKNLPDDEASWKKSDDWWTRNVQSAVAKIGKGREYNIYASKLSRCEREGGEWLFDLCWLKYQSGNHDKSLINVGLALESEWNIHGVKEDFEKLIVARAEHRVMVFEVPKKSDRDLEFKKLIGYVEEYGQSTAGDRYLMCCWQGREFDSRVYQAS